MMYYSEENIAEIAKRLHRNMAEALEEISARARLEEQIQSPPDDVLKNFVKEEIIDPRAFVSPLRVQGTYHPDYWGLSWKEFFWRGKRIKQNLELLEHNPGYYLDMEPKVPTMYYVAWGDRIFVGDDGNHRTAIARAFFGALDMPGQMLGRVHLVSYMIDREIWNLFYDLQLLTAGGRCSLLGKRPRLIFKPERKIIARTDAVENGDRVVNHYQVKLVIENHIGERLIVDRTNVMEALEAIEEHRRFLRLPFWKRKLKRFILSGSDTQVFLLKALRG